MQKRSALFRNFDTIFFSMLLLMATLYILLHDLYGGTLFAHSDWDSYTLQALAWRKGQLWLDQNYSWLELAVFNGHYYVSFPPVPTLVMLPLTFIFGADTPGNFVMVLYALLTVAISYRVLRNAGVNNLGAALVSVSLVCGSSMMWMSMNSGVWFQAQLLCMLLCVLCVWAAGKDKRFLAYFLLALAVGCRPFSILYFPVLFFYFYQKRDPQQKKLKAALSQWKYWIAPAVIGGAYMLFNQARFGNVLEFGHNYLPEFTESALGQFSLSYLPENLYNLFLRPVTIGKNFTLSYPIFNGFLFYLANPLFIVFAADCIRRLRRKEFGMTSLLICAAMLLNLLLLCAHKTLGGWQFGARYTVDLLPFAVFSLSLSRGFELKKWEGSVLIFGILFNVYGTLAMQFLYS